MTDYLSVVATTGIVKQGGTSVLISKEAIESIPQQIAGDHALPIVPDHDPFCLPIGKVQQAWTESDGDQCIVKAVIHIEDAYQRATHEASGLELVILDFDENPKPFERRGFYDIEQQKNTLSVDLANFDDHQHYTEFVKDVQLIDDEMVCDNRIGRHSLVPEPFIQVVLSNLDTAVAVAIGGWVLQRGMKFVNYTVDKTLEKVGDDFSDSFSMKMKKILGAYGSHQSDDNRPTVTQIVMPGNMELILLVKTEHNEEFPTMDLEKLAVEMEKYTDLLQEADSATFARVGINDWKFQYLTTQSGKVIGTHECCERTVEKMNSISQGRDKEA